jgi:hypothetical protein
MTIIEDPEDEAWAELEAQQKARKAQDDWVCPFCYTKGCPTPKECRELALRNQVIEEIAQHIEKFHVFGRDTISSFAIYIRGLKK